MSTEITVVNDIVEINVSEEVIVIEAPSGAYPLPTGVYSVYGRTGNVVAQDGDYNLTQLGDVTIVSPATGQVLRYNGTTWVNSTESYVGTVTSVAMTTPTGLTVTGSPITTSGTLAVGLQSGYSIPTDANQTNWTTAYNDKINSAAVTGLATKTLTLTQQDGGTITTTWTDTEATNLITEVYNQTGATIAKGSVVYINGAHGNLPTITKAQANSEVNSAQTYGLVRDDITNNNNGYVTVAGRLGDLNTSSFTDGTTLYLSPTVAGGYTSTKPTSPDHIVFIGVVVRSHPSQGVIEVNIQNTQELAESSDVLITTPTGGQILQYNGTTSLWNNVAGTTTNIAEGTNLYYTDARSRAAFSESVTGLDYNSTTGVLSTTSGYGIPTTASQATWNTAYNDSIVSAGVTGTTTKTLTLNQQDGGTITASWTDYDTAPVTSVFGRTGAVVATSGDYNTSQVTENTNLYFTNTRARAAISETVTGLDYDNTTGVLSTTTGYGIPTTASQTNWDTAYTNRITSASAPLSIASNAISISQANSTTNGYLSSTDWNTFNNKQAAGNYITALTGEATASGPGSASVTLTNSAVIGKVLTGLNVTGGTVIATDSILAAFGKVQNQINGLIGGSIYQGVWNASTNTPTLTSSVGTKGYYYIVNVAGSTNLDGITDWKVGDWAIYDGTAWQKVDNTDAVSSVNGFTGAVSLTTDNISEGSTNLYFTNTRAQNAITLTTTGTSGAATYSGGTLNIPQYQAVLTNPVTGTGTTNTLPKFTGTSAIGNSNITDTGSLITLGSNSYTTGYFGIGATPATGQNFLVSRGLTGSTVTRAVYASSPIQSDVTAVAVYFSTDASTQAASFTLGSLTHYQASTSTLGAGSSVTTQYGFRVLSTITGATNNYGFYGDIPSGTNRWNLYMNGTAANYLAGDTSIGTTTGGYKLNVNGTTNLNGLLTGTNTVFSSTVANGNTIAWFDNNNTTTDQSFGLLVDAGTSVNDYALRVRNAAASELFKIAGNGAATFSSSVSAASFIPTSSTIPTNGMYLSGTNTLGFATNSTLDMVLDANGNMGVGTTSPSTYTNLNTITINGTNGSVLDLKTGNVLYGEIYSLANELRVDAVGASSSLRLLTNSVTRLTINPTGSIGIGTTSLTGINLAINKTITGATSAYGVYQNATIQSDVTTQAYAFRSNISTAASAFTLSQLFHYQAVQGTIGATSAVTSQFGFAVDSSLIGATNNYGFFGNIASGTNRWNIYMSGTANNYMAGSLGIGSTSLTQFNFRVSKTITGNITSYAQINDGIIQSDVTTGVYYRSTAATAAATFTTDVQHFNASQGTFGAGSTVTNQYGYLAANTLIGATNNYGFFGSIPSGTNRWNLYMAGTAYNYLGGRLGIGQTSATSTNLVVNLPITGGAGSNAIYQFGTVQSDVLSSAYGFRNLLNTAAASFTLPIYNHYAAQGGGTIGAGSVVTNQIGFNVENNMVGATNNYGFYGSLASATNTWNLYMAGTAANYMAGQVGIGATSINASAKVQVDSTTQGFLPPRMTSAQRTAIATPATGLMVYQTDGTEGVYVYTSAGWKSLTMV